MRKEIVLKGPSAVGSTVTNVDNSTWFSTTPILSEILVLRPWILQLDKSLTKVLWICKIIQQKLFSILNFDKTSILSELSYKVLSDKSLPFSVMINEKSQLSTMAHLLFSHSDRLICYGLLGCWLAKVNVY